MTEFTPVASLIGGALIGLSAVLMMYFHGRIAGVSGFASRLLPPFTDNHWLGRFSFILGIVIAPVLFAFADSTQAYPAIPGSIGLLGIGGLVVGFGAALGNGCTSGHGVCGLSRFSKRSIVATATFMLVAILTVTIRRHML